MREGVSKQDYIKISSAAEDVIEMCENNRWQQLALDQKNIEEDYELRPELAMMVKTIGNRALSFSRISESWYKDMGANDQEREIALAKLFGIRFESAPRATLSSHIHVELSAEDLVKVRHKFEKNPEGETLGFVSKELPYFSFAINGDSETERHERQHIRNKFLMPESHTRKSNAFGVMLAQLKDELVAQITTKFSYEELLLKLSSSKYGYKFGSRFRSSLEITLSLYLSKALEKIETSNKDYSEWATRLTLESSEIESLIAFYEGKGKEVFIEKFGSILIEKKLINLEELEEFEKISPIIIKCATIMQEQAQGDITTLLAVTPVNEWGKLIKR